MADCTINDYYIYYTDRCKGLELCSENGNVQPCCSADDEALGEAIIISKSALIEGERDITFVGRTRLEYGENFNENILHLLENFAAPATTSVPLNPVPDVFSTTDYILSNPTEGQVWFNNTNNVPYVAELDGEDYRWNRMATFDDVAGNHGIIAHGEQIPLPINRRNQLTPGTIPAYNYSECSFTVSPLAWRDEIKSFECTVDASGNVTVQYVLMNDTVVNGLAMYTILAIRENEA